MFLVTAAYGNQGKILIPKLRAAGFEIRAVRAKAGGEEELKALGAHEVLIGDTADRHFLRKALKGIDNVYHIGPSAHAQEREMGFAMIDVAREVGLKHLIYNSVLHPIASKLLQHKSKRDVEEHLIESDLNFTILQPSDFMLPVMFQAAFSGGVLELPWSLDRRQAMIDLQDLTDCVVKVAQEGERHYSASYELSAPGNHTAYDLAAAVAQATGRPCATREITALQYFTEFFGMPPGEEHRYPYRVMQTICFWYSNNHFMGNPNILTWLLGREPTTLQQFVDRAWKDFQAA